MYTRPSVHSVDIYLQLGIPKRGSELHQINSENYPSNATEKPS